AADEPDLYALSIDPAPSPQLTYEEFKVQELERKARRSRNALIGTGAAAAFGLIIAIPVAATQCDTVTRSDGKEDYECSSAGDALLGVASPFIVGGLTGVVITGIMLGVRKGKLRRLNDGIRYDRNGYAGARAFRWDETRGKFVF
ncbi:MAG: hypothetical protein AAF997_09570, partial [Myxococcota bacterium]